MSASWEDVFPSSPITGETAATVGLVASDWRADEDWRRFQMAVQAAAGEAMGGGAWTWEQLARAGAVIDPNRVRVRLVKNGELTIEPRRYSAFWHRASKGKDAFLVADGWVENTDRKGGNAGKPLRRYRLREAS